MKEQTAMQELIEQAKTGKEFSKDGFVTWEEVIEAATELLTKEREQIVEAWQDGYANGCSVGGNDYTTETENDTGTHYFTTTYKQP